jgi:hypothetical protein
MNQSCRFLSNGYKFNVNQQGDLVVRPCCLYPPEQIVHNKIDLTQWREKTNIINSYTDKNCSDCNFLDRTKVRRSRRELSFLTVPDNAKVGDPSFLEIQLDTTCNGGCIMCGPHFSSYWAQELKIPIVTSAREDYLSKIAKLVDFQKVNNIILLGGEPLLSTVDERLIDLIDDPSQVSIQFTTNGSIYPKDARIQHWEKFKNVNINFSIDGIQRRFEYIRYPLKWEVVEKNMLRMQAEMPGNVTFKINHTVNILNLLFFDEFEEWFNNYFKTNSKGQEWNYTATPAAGLLNPKSITPFLKEMVLARYSPEQIPAKIIEDTNRDCSELLTFLSTLDSRRDNNWQHEFSEIQNCIQ